MVLKVVVSEYDTIEVKPKLTQTVKQYVILTEDEHGRAEVFFVDKDKYNKEKFIEAVKKKYSARYRIPETEVEVAFLVDIG